MVATKRKSSNIINLPKPQKLEKKKRTITQNVLKQLEKSFVRFILRERKVYRELPKDKTLPKESIAPLRRKKSLLERKNLKEMSAKAWFSMKQTDGMIRSYVTRQPDLNAAVFPVFDEDVLQLLVAKICHTHGYQNPNLSKEDLFGCYLNCMQAFNLNKAAASFVVPIHLAGSHYALLVMTSALNQHQQKVMSIKYYDELNGKIPVDLKKWLQAHFQRTEQPAHILFETVKRKHMDEKKNSSVYTVLKAIDILNEFNKTPFVDTERFNIEDHRKRYRTFKLLLSNALPQRRLHIKYNLTFYEGIQFQQNELMGKCRDIIGNEKYGDHLLEAREFCAQALNPLVRNPRIPAAPRFNEKGEKVKITSTSGHTLTSEEILIRCKKFRQKLQILQDALVNDPAISEQEKIFLRWVDKTIFAFEQAKDKLSGQLKLTPPKEKKQAVPKLKRYKRSLVDDTLWGRFVSGLLQKRKQASAWMAQATWKTLAIYLTSLAALLLMVPLLPANLFMTALAGSMFFGLGYGLVYVLCNQVELRSSKENSEKTLQAHFLKPKKTHPNSKRKVHKKPKHPKNIDIKIETQLTQQDDSNLKEEPLGQLWQFQRQQRCRRAASFLHSSSEPTFLENYPVFPKPNPRSFLRQSS